MISLESLTNATSFEQFLATERIDVGDIIGELESSVLASVGAQSLDARSSSMAMHLSVKSSAQVPSNHELVNAKGYAGCSRIGRK